MHTDYQRRVPPREPNVFVTLSGRQYVCRTRAEHPVMNDRVRLERVIPDARVHQKTMECPLEEAGVKKENDESYNWF